MMSPEKKKKVAKKKIPARRAKKTVQESPVIAAVAVSEKKTTLARATFVLNRVVIVSSISAYVIALVLAGFSVFATDHDNAISPNVAPATATQPASGTGKILCPSSLPGASRLDWSDDAGNCPNNMQPVAPTTPAAAQPATPAQPQPPATGNSGDLQTNLAAAGGVAYPGGGPANIGVYIARFILFFFGALGLMFTCYIFYAGFLWLTAAGEEDKVKKARAIIFHSTLALAICVMAFTISKLWLEGLAKAAR